MLNTKEKIFEMGCKAISAYINSSIEEERREEVKAEVFGLLSNIKNSKNKNAVRTTISKFRVSNLQPETHKLLRKLNYTLIWNKEDENDPYFQLVRGGNGKDLL